MSEDAREKRLLMIRSILELSDEEVSQGDNFTYWGKPGVITSSHDNGGSHPPDPPPPPPPGLGD